MSVLKGGESESFGLAIGKQLNVSASVNGVGTWRRAGMSGVAAVGAFPIPKNQVTAIGPFSTFQNISVECATAQLSCSVVDAASSGGGEIVHIDHSQTINAANADMFNGKMLVFDAAYSLTLAVGLPANFGFAVYPPASGNASIVSDGTVKFNGATTTLTRAASANTLFGVAAIGNDGYAVTGS